jgi:hypothetical protein
MLTTTYSATHKYTSDVLGTYLHSFQSQLCLVLFMKTFIKKEKLYLYLYYEAFGKICLHHIPILTHKNIFCDKSL